MGRKAGWLQTELPVCAFLPEDMAERKVFLKLKNMLTPFYRKACPWTFCIESYFFIIILLIIDMPPMYSYLIYAQRPPGINKQVHTLIPAKL